MSEVRMKAKFADGVVSEKSFNNMDELTNYISSLVENITTMEIDIESSNNHRPAFWSEE